MKKPKFSTFVIGSPMVMMLAGALLLFGIYRWSQDPTSWPLTAIALACLSVSSNASMRIDTYKAWQRDWDSMNGLAPEKTRSKGHPLLGSLLMLGLGMFLATHAHDSAYAMALVGMVVSVILAGVAWLLTRLKAARQRAMRTPNPQQKSVEICVNRPLLSVPELADAYRALPPHCRILFDFQQQPARALELS